MNYSEIEEDVKKMIQDLGTSNINFLEVEFPNGLKIKMDKGNNKILPNTVPVSMPVTASAPVISNNVENKINAEKVEIKEKEENYKEIKSPMVGTFYASPSPKAEPFVKVGDKVKKGQVVCIVEAMKLMNEIESEFDGEVVEILKKNEDMVEYGTTLFKIK